MNIAEQVASITAKEMKDVVLINVLGGALKPSSSRSSPMPGRMTAAERVRNRAIALASEGKVMKRRDAGKTLKDRYRETEEALAECLERGWLVEVRPGAYRPGRV